MRKSMLIVLSGLFLALSLAGQSLTLFHVPKYNTEPDFGPSIAANRYGDIMIFYANTKKAVMYYLKMHNSNDWIGPEPVPDQPYGDGWGSDIFDTDMVASKDGNFHCIWTMLDSGDQSGIHYAKFDIKAGKWTEQAHILPSDDKTEEPTMAYNPKKDEIIVAWCWLHFVNKDIYLISKPATGGSWSEPIDIAYLGFADTNPSLGCAEDGYTCIAYKTDRLIPGGDPKEDSSWELVIRLHLLDEDNQYRSIWADEVTWDYNGWHFLPQVALLKDGIGMMTFCWYQRFNYFFLLFQIKDNQIIYDQKTIPDNPICPFPTVPHYMFQSRLMSYVDEFVFAPKIPNHTIDMKRYKDGVWTAPINISEGEPTLTWYPHDLYTEPKVGILSAWTNLTQAISFSIYDLKKIVIQPPVNLDMVHKSERSLFKQTYFNVITWENDPENTANNINVVKWILYRKAKGEAAYTKFTEFPAATLKFIDTVDVTAVNMYDYALTAVDEKGNESVMAEIKK